MEIAVWDLHGDLDIKEHNRIIARGEHRVREEGNRGSGFYGFAGGVYGMRRPRHLPPLRTRSRDPAPHTARTRERTLIRGATAVDDRDP